MKRKEGRKEREWIAKQESGIFIIFWHKKLDASLRQTSQQPDFHPLPKILADSSPQGHPIVWKKKSQNFSRLRGPACGNFPPKTHSFFEKELAGKSGHASSRRKTCSDYEGFLKFFILWTEKRNNMARVSFGDASMGRRYLTAVRISNFSFWFRTRPRADFPDLAENWIVGFVVF